MSRKVTDVQGRWRSKTVSFRMSPEENALLDSYARLSGMTKQDCRCSMRTLAHRCSLSTTMRR